MADLTNAELLEIAKDPRFNESDLALMSPGDQAKLKQIQQRGGQRRPGAPTLDAAVDVGVGAAKGAGQTAYNLGSMAQSIPGIGDVLKLASRLGVKGADWLSGTSHTPEEEKATVEHAFDEEVPDVLAAKNTAQTVGKFGEQVGEFFLPAGPARLAAIEKLVQAIPNAASPQKMALLNKLAAYAGRAVGEGGSGAAVAAVHGDDDPETAALIGGLSPGIAEALKALPGGLKNPLVRRILPVLLGGAGAHAVGAVTGNVAGGLGAGYGIYSGARAGTKYLMEHPKTIPMLETAVGEGTKYGARAAEGVTDQTKIRRRRLEGLP